MEDLIKLLENYKAGQISNEQMLEEIKAVSYRDLGFARVDHHRKLRQDFPEVIFCPGKDREHIVEILVELKSKNGLVLATKAEQDVADFILSRLPKAVYHKKGKIISYGRFPEVQTTGYAYVITAGTADIAIAEEALTTLKAAGIKTETSFDCGVAGIHRITSELNKIQKAKAIIVIAGMEGALASLVGGIASCPVIGVPTSIGYGASFNGIAALLGMLNSCSSTVSVVNIDNGFSAARIATMIVKQSDIEI